MVISAILAIATHATPARADDEADKAAITDRLQRWAAAFNSRDARGACDLFADSLVSTVPSALDAGRETVCQRLAAILARPDITLHYTPDIREIILAGDIAVVRLFWTLTSQRGDERSVSTEAGLDIFQRRPSGAPGGTWSVIRFMAFTADPALP